LCYGEDSIFMDIFSMLYRIIIVIALCFAGNALAVQKEKSLLSMAALAQHHIVQHDGLGSLDIMFKDIELETGISHQYSVTSRNRGLRKFVQNKVGCLFPVGELPSKFQNIDIISSTPFAQMHFLAFTPLTKPTISDRTQLHGKVIGITRHNASLMEHAIFNQLNVDFVQVSKVESLIELLDKERIDIAIHSELDFLVAAEQAQQKFHYDDDYIDINASLKVVCHNTQVAQYYLSKVNPVLANYYQKGLESYFKRSVAAQ